MSDRGETLISVPCWWDGDIKSLVSTIREVRPELCLNSKFSESPSISKIPPKDFFKVARVPDVGELMLASIADPVHFDPYHWWMGEKYEGTRSCWNPVKQTLYSRFGRKIGIMPSFKQTFPNSFLDGELWLGRGHMYSVLKLSQIGTEDQLTNETSGKFPSGDFWPFLRLAVFDDADPNGRIRNFEERFGNVLSSVSLDNPFIIPTSYLECKSKEHVKEATEKILQNSGEGIVLRDKKSIYISGRSESLLKLKALRDQEALVIDVNKDECVLQLPNGTEFQTKLNPHYFKNYTKNYSSTNPDTIGEETTAQPFLDQIPNPGDIVTFSYSGYTSEGIPTDAKLHFIRGDLTWPDVISSFHSDNPEKRNADVYTQLVFTSISTTRQPHGHWTGDGQNTKKFFDSYAQIRNLNPQDPHTWFGVTQKDILQVPGGPSILYHFGGSVVRALAHVYPHLDLQESQFDKMTRNYWLSIANRRNFFDTMAKRKGFDPLKPSHWYSLKRGHVLNEKGGVSLLTYYKGSVAHALADIYPDIGLDISLFGFTPEEDRWMPLQARRQFFDNYAKQNNFDPLVAHNWYSITPEDLLSTKEGAIIMKHNRESVAECILEVYPDIGLEKHKFNSKACITARARKWFDQLAHDLSFDPLIPSNWYLLRKSAVIDNSEGESILKKYDGSLVEALSDAYPDIGLEASKFSNLFPYKFWLQQSKRRELMDLIANKKGFDPLSIEQWNKVKREDFIAEKGGYEMLQYCYSGSLPRAIKHIYSTSSQPS